MLTLRALCCPVLLVLLAAWPAFGAERRSGSHQELRRELRSRGLDPETLIFPDAIDDKMIAWLDEVIPSRLSKDETVTILLDQLLSHSELDLGYDKDYTATAIEAFETGRANCLTFTHLFIGLSRHLDLPVFYLRVNDLLSFEREGDLVVVSGHVTAAYGSGARPQILEFAIYPVGDYRSVRALSDITALALFYSNRGAEMLLAGDLPVALEWLETAVRIDPTLPEAWVNLGVVRRRSGEPDAAEASYWQALEADPDYALAYQNLSALLATIEGRQEEGRQLLVLTDRVGNRNPFNYLTLGDLSLAQDRLEDAGRYYRRALSLSPSRAETQAAMGQWSLAVGRAKRAGKWLRKARKVDPQAARVLRLQADLSRGDGSS